MDGFRLVYCTAKLARDTRKLIFNENESQRSSWTLLILGAGLETYSSNHATCADSPTRGQPTGTLRGAGRWVLRSFRWLRMVGVRPNDSHFPSPYFHLVNKGLHFVQI